MRPEVAVFKLIDEYVKEEDAHIVSEEQRDNSGQGFTTEEASRVSDIEQEEANSSPTEYEQEHHQDKDTKPTPKVTWSDLGAESVDETAPVAQSGQKETLEHGCVAVPGIDTEGTFLTSVNGQDEGLGNSSSQLKLGLEVKGADNNSDLAVDNHMIFQDPVGPTGRPKTSRPRPTFRTDSGSKDRKSLRRPYSAADVKNFSIDTHARPHPLYTATGVLSSDYQQPREDSLSPQSIRLVTGVRSRPVTAMRSRRVTAATQKFELVHPPPQRPTSPVSNTTVIRSRGLKVTSTKSWLGGGRDLYWEDVQNQPKSGHSPGWRDGLPDSMRKRRSKSAHVTSTRFHPSESLDMKHKIMDLYEPHLGDTDVSHMMPDVYPLLQHQQHLASSPASDDSQTIFPPLRPFSRH